MWLHAGYATMSMAGGPLARGLNRFGSCLIPGWTFRTLSVGLELGQGSTLGSAVESTDGGLVSK